MTKEFLEGIVGLREGIVLVALLLVGAIVAIDLFIPLPSKSSASICFIRWISPTIYYSTNTTWLAARIEIRMIMGGSNPR
jgi:hypothetical protein